MEDSSNSMYIWGLYYFCGYLFSIIQTDAEEQLQEVCKSNVQVI